jgi:pilus assembly protein Flp/PilA
MRTTIYRFINDEQGATAIEYGLIATIVGIGIIASLTTLKDGLNTVFSNVNTNLAN